MDAFLVTCEHGGNAVPAAYRRLFRGRRALLDSHRGYDPGALAMARALADAFDAPLVASTVSRLVVDLNRSRGHPRLFSAATRGTPAAVRAQILDRHYGPYRAHVERIVGAAVARGRRVIHVSSHTFTPELDGKVRRADVGLLYHPGRPRRGAAVRALEGRARRPGARAPGAPQLPVRRQGRWPHRAPARVLPARRLRRDRARDQPGHRRRAAPTLERVAGRADRFVARGVR